jgi:hypothetical protein
MQVALDITRRESLTDGRVISGMGGLWHWRLALISTP